MVSRLTVAVLVALCGAHEIALAAPTDAEAQQAQKLFEAGRQAYDAGQYPLAISLFEEAYRLVPRPSAAFGLGQAYRRQYLVDGLPEGLVRAIDYYRKYLADAPDGDRRDDAIRYIADLELIRARLDAERADETSPAAPRERTQLVVFSSTPQANASVDGAPAERLPLALDVTAGKHLVRVEADGYFPREVEGVAIDGRLVPIEVTLEARPGQLELRARTGAVVEIDGRRVGTTPLRAALELPAGKHFVAVQLRGYRPFARELSLARGEAVVLEAAMPITAQRRASYWVMGAAGVSMVAGLVATGFALAADADATEFEDRIAAGQTLSVDDRDQLNAAADRYDDYTTASYVLYGGALALGVTSLLLYVLDDPGASPPPEVHPSVVGGDGLGVSWSGRF